MKVMPLIALAVLFACAQSPTDKIQPVLDGYFKPLMNDPASYEPAGITQLDTVQIAPTARGGSGPSETVYTMTYQFRGKNQAGAVVLESYHVALNEDLTVRAADVID